MAIAEEALDELLRTLQQFFPEAPNPALRPQVSLAGLHAAPSGIGHLVGLSHAPEGDIRAQRVEATVRVTARANDADELAATVGSISRALLIPDLRARGVLRLSLDQLGDVSSATVDGASLTQRDLQLSVLFEYLELPTADGERVIRQVPLDLELGRGRPARVIFGQDFGERALDWFEIIDDAAATIDAPSNWVFGPPERRIEQRSAIRGGSNGADSNKPGTYLVLRADSNRPPVQDFVLNTVISSAAGGSVGLVFRWQDADNFGFFVMNAQHHYRVLGKKANGSFAPLNTPAIDTSVGFDVGALNDVKLVGDGSTLSVHVNSDFALRGDDASLVRAGRFGFACYGNNQAQFSRLRLTAL